MNLKRLFGFGGEIGLTDSQEHDFDLYVQKIKNENLDLVEDFKRLFLLQQMELLRAIDNKYKTKARFIFAVLITFSSLAISFLINPTDFKAGLLFGVAALSAITALLWSYGE